MSETNNKSKCKKGNRKYKTQRKKETSMEHWGTDMELTKEKIQNEKNEKGNNKREPYKFRKQHKTTKAQLNEFTFKNAKEKKSKYTNVGIQTLSPIKICIDDIFNQGFNTNTLDSNGITMVKEDELFDTIDQHRNSSIDMNMCLMDNDGRKWSNVSTIIGDESLYYNNTRRSSSLTSNITLVGNGTNLNKDKVWNGGGDSMLYEDPFLLKEPLTIEDLHSSDLLRLDRDINRLKNAIEGNKSASNDVVSPTEINKGIWLEYPLCCYNSVLQD